MKYPLPAYAASIWVAGDNLMVQFPGQGPEGREHTIKLPVHENGLKTAIKILKDRAQAEALTIANRGTPSQWQAENDARYRAFHKALQKDRKDREQEKREAEEFLKELGL